MRAQKNRDQSREQRKRREVPTLDGVQHSVVQRFATGVIGGRTDARPTAVGQSAPEGDQEISQEICRRGSFLRSDQSLRYAGPYQDTVMLRSQTEVSSLSE